MYVLFTNGNRVERIFRVSALSEVQYYCKQWKLDDFGSSLIHSNA